MKGPPGGGEYPLEECLSINYFVIPLSPERRPQATQEDREGVPGPPKHRRTAGQAAPTRYTFSSPVAGLTNTASTASAIAVATPSTNTPPTTPPRILEVPNLDTLQVEIHTHRTLHERQTKTLAIARTNHAYVEVPSRKTYKRRRDTSAEAEGEGENEQGRDKMHTRRTLGESQAKPQAIARTNHAFVAVPSRRTYKRKLNASAEAEGEGERDPAPSPPVVVPGHGRPRKGKPLVLPSARVRHKKRLLPPHQRFTPGIDKMPNIEGLLRGEPFVRKFLLLVFQMTVQALAHAKHVR